MIGGIIKKHAVQVLLFGAAVFTGAVASAQNATTEQAVALDTVVVVGEKLNRNLQDTMTSVGRVDAEDLADIAAFDVQQAFDRLVNVNVEGPNGGFVIRGVPFSEVSGTGSGGVGQLGVFYIDGVRLSQRGLRFGPDTAWDIASIEVLRGAQSTLQGRNALAGAIHVRTKEAGYDWEGSTRALLAEGGRQNIAVAIGGPIVDDVLAFRLAIENDERDGFVPNPVLGTEGDFSDRLTVRGKLLFEPTSDLRIDAVLNYSDVSQFDEFSDNRSLNASGFIDIDPGTVGATPNAASTGPLRRRTLLNIGNDETTETLAALLRATWSINDQVTLTSETSYTKDESVRVFDNDNGVFDYSSLGMPSIPFEDPLGINRFEDFSGFRGATSFPLDPIFVEEEENEIFSQEFRVNYRTDSFNAVAGAYFTTEDEDEISYNQQVFVGAQILIEPAALDAVGDPGVAALVTSLYSNFVPLSVLSDEPVSVDNYAVFAEADFYLTERLTLTAGVRYDDEEIEVGIISSGILVGFPDPATAAATVDTATGGAVPAAAIEPLFAGINAAFDTVSPLAAGGGVFNTQNYDAWLPKIGLRYSVSDNVSVGTVIQRGYRAGSLSINVPRQLTFSLEPEFTWNYEVFLRSEFDDGRGTLNANVYFTDWTDQQVGFPLNPANPFDSGAANASSSELYGFELDTRYNFDNGLSIYGGIGYSITEFKDFTLTLTDDLAAAGFANADLANLGTGFTGNRFPFAPEWSVVAGGSWTNGPFTASLNASYQGEAFNDPGNNREIDARTLVSARIAYEQDHWSAFVFARNLFDEEHIVSPSQFRTRLGEPRVAGAGIQFNF